jgi:PKD repeat protein
MRAILLSILLFLSVQIVYSQGYLNIKLPRDGHYGLWGIIDAVEHENNIWCVGSQYHSSTGNGVRVLIKINSLGEIDTTIFLTDPIEVSLTPSILIHNNFIYVVINYKPTLESNGTTPMLIKFDLDGNEIWRQNYSSPERVFAFRMKITSDNNIIMWGQRSTLPGSSYPRCFYIRKFNLDGEILWDQTYWPSYNSNANSLIETSDGGFMISGQSQRHFTSSFQFRVIKTDHFGNVIWDKDLGKSGFHNGGGRISELTDGTFVGTSAYEITSDLRLARMVFFDSAGTVIRENEFEFGNYATFSESVVLNDGTFVVQGIGKNQFNEQYVNLMKFDPLGNMIWQHAYTNMPNWPSVGYSLKPTANNGVMFVGSTWVETDVTFEQRGWLVKTDCFGCDSLLCYYEDSTCLVYDCTEYPTSPQFTVSEPVFSAFTGTTYTFTQTETGNTTMRYWDMGDGTILLSAESIEHTYIQAGTYTVKLRSHHSACYDEYEQEIVVTQNIGESYANDGSDKEEDLVNVGLETWENDFKVYPNPANQSLHVLFEQVEGSIRIVNIMGEVVYENIHFQHYDRIQLEQFRDGLYILQCTNAKGENFFARFIVIK